MLPCCWRIHIRDYDLRGRGGLESCPRHLSSPLKKSHNNPLTRKKSTKEGGENKVIFKGAQPQDFRRSEQLVLTGKMKDGVFYASNILMKCPSKYVNNEIKVVQEASLIKK